MAKTIDIAINVREAASRPLKKVEDQMRKTGRQAKKTGVDFTQFNRVMFSTTAFIGIFTYAMNRLSASMTEAAKMDRVINQYEKTVGPKGELISMIRQMTTTSIDFFEAMKSGIAMRSLGIASNTKQIAELVARAGVAAKLAGKDSSEGIKQFTQFLKDGAVAHLENLNLIKRTNFGLKIQQAILGRYGGVAGGALSAAQRLAIGLDLLRKKTEGSMKSQRDYLDVLQDLKLFSKLAGQETKTLALAAFAPLLDKVKNVMFAIANFAERIRKTDKEILFLIKTIGLATAAVTGLFAAFGSLRLLSIALGAVGIGIPALTGILVTLGTTFLSVTHGADGLMERLKVFGSVFKGTFQLTKSFLSSPENFAKGIGLIDSELANLLRKHGLLDLVTQIARVTSSITMFAKGVATGFKDSINFIIDKVGFVGKALLKILGINPGVWSRFWVEGIQDIGKAIGKLTGGILALTVAFTALKSIKTVFGKLPIIGKIFGGTGGALGNKPKGTITDPIFVSMAGKSIEKLASIFSKIGPMLRNSLASIIMSFQAGAAGATGITGVIRGIGGVVGGVLPILKNIGILAGAFALVAGLSQAVYNNFDELAAAGKLLYVVIKDKLVNSITYISNKLVDFSNNLMKIVSSLADKLGLTQLVELFNPNKAAPAGTAGQIAKSVALGARAFGQAAGEFISSPIASTAGVLTPDVASLARMGHKSIAETATPEERLARLQETQQQLEGAKRKAFTEALVAAQSDKIVTAEEYLSIMRIALGETVGKLEEPLNKTAENTVRSEATATVKRGC